MVKKNPTAVLYAQPGCEFPQRSVAGSGSEVVMAAAAVVGVETRDEKMMVVQSAQPTRLETVVVVVVVVGTIGRKAQSARLGMVCGGEIEYS